MVLTLREGDFASFFEAPFACYGGDSPYASPMRGDLERSLDPTRNPLFRDYARRTWFTAHRGGRVVGRVLAHIHDASNRLHGLGRGYFGCLDCADDPDVARALLEAAGAWVRERGCTELAGGFNLTITQLIGIVTDGFEHPPYSYQDYNPPHVPRLLEALGFEPFFPMRTFEADLRPLQPETLLGERQRALLADARWSWRPIARRGLEQRLREACDVLNDGFHDNAMFVPLTPEEFLFPCAGLTWVIDERISFTAYEAGRPVGVVLCIPDLNPFLRATRSRLGWRTPWHLIRLRLARRRAAIIFFAVRRSHHGLGVNGVLLYHLVRALQAGGYERLGVSWISDGNLASLRQTEKLGAQPLHRLHLFRRPL
jgi:GNAT superfamily N-acetyltransferase